MVVYFARPIGMRGPIKIGCSRWPANRLASLSIWSPFPLEIVAVIEGGDLKLERRLHGMFAASHKHREWFDPAPALEALIERLQAGDSIEQIIDTAANVLPFRAARVRTPELAKRMSYRQRIHWAFKKANGGRAWSGRFRAPADVDGILSRWSGCAGHEHREPTAEELQRLERVIEQPTKFLRKRARAAA